MEVRGRKNRTTKSGRWRLPVVAAVMLCAVLISNVLTIESAVNKLAIERVLPEGTRINGRDVGGMTHDEASGLIIAAERAALDSVAVTMNCMGRTYELDSAALGITGDAENVLKNAADAPYAGIGGVEEDIRYALDTPSGGEYQTSLIIDGARVRECVEGLLADMYSEPVDATVSFDAASAKFSYTHETWGVRADTESAYAEVLEAVKGGESVVNVAEIPIEPAVTEAQLRANTVEIAMYETTASNNPNRDANIALMCEAVNGYVVQPDAVLSINELVGERTEAKGFKKAPAIMDGKVLEDDLGGGICQLAGTLYNAALLADMEIVERVHHSFPSAYLPIGLDATLNWDNKDLKIRNRSEYPIYISAQFVDHVVSVRIFGQPPQEGMEIVVTADIVNEQKPGSAEIIFTDMLAPGETATKVQARTGYEVKTYREYYLNGELVDKQLLYYDKYRAINAVIYKGSDTEPK